MFPSLSEVCTYIKLLFFAWLYTSHLSKALGAWEYDNEYEMGK